MNGKSESIKWPTMIETDARGRRWIERADGTLVPVSAFHDEAKARATQLRNEAIDDALRMIVAGASRAFAAVVSFLSRPAVASSVHKGST